MAKTATKAKKSAKTSVKNGRATSAKTNGKASRGASTATPKTDYKVGARVKVTRRSGEVVKGIVSHVEQKSTGNFVHVKVDRPTIIKARPIAVAGY